MKVFVALTTATLSAAAVALPLAADAGGAFGGGRPAMMSGPMGSQSFHGTVINPDMIPGGGRSGFGSGVDSGYRNRSSTVSGAKHATRPLSGTGLATAKSDSRGVGLAARQTEGFAPPK